MDANNQRQYILYPQADDEPGLNASTREIVVLFFMFFCVVGMLNYGNFLNID